MIKQQPGTSEPAPSFPVRRGFRQASVTALAVLGLVGAGLGAQAPRPASTELPESPGVEIVRTRCLSCHEADMVAGQRLTEAGWGREIDKMIRWGARVPDTDRTSLQAYLARHFAPGPSPAHEPSSIGEAVFKRACLACHGVDLVESQRLSLAGWTREVDKMVRWGARVADTEKEPLAQYLAAAHPPR